jgi:hypothetical protein
MLLVNLVLDEDLMVHDKVKKQNEIISAKNRHYHVITSLHFSTLINYCVPDMNLCTSTWHWSVLETNKKKFRFEPKHDLFRFIFGLFRETKNYFFQFVSVRFGFSDPFRNKRNKPIYFETNKKNTKETTNLFIKLCWKKLPEKKYSTVELKT